MNRAPYIFARSPTLADQVFFHRRNLAERLLALGGGRKLVLRPAVLGRAATPSGPAIRVYARTNGADEALGYVLRAGLDASEIRERLWAELDGLGEQPMREAA